MQESPLNPAGQARAAVSEAAIAKARNSTTWQAWWKRWIGEPLFHFLFIGAALFVVYRALNPTAQANVRTNVIELTQDDLLQMSVAWLAQGRPAPTPEQMRHLVEAKVREEILHREALALGLDKGDTIIRRRLAQKMEFLSEDLSAVSEPVPGELEAWFAKNTARFTVPPRISFRHLYFSPDRRGAGAREDAERALAKLAGASADAAVTAELADPFMFQDNYGERSPEQLLKLFGAGFARDIFSLEPGSWQGPIASGYGWHLVFADTIIPSRVPPFEEIEAEVKSAWIEERRTESKQKMYQAMRARYRVVLPELTAQAAAVAKPDPVATNR